MGDVLADGARQPTHAQQRAEQLDLAHALAQRLQVQVLDTLDLNTGAVDEGARGNDMG